MPLTHDSASVVRVGLPGRCRGWPRWFHGAASHDPLILDRQRRSPRYRWSWPSSTDARQRAWVDEVPGGQRQAGQATEGAMMAEGLGMQPQCAGRRGPGSLMRAWLLGAQGALGVKFLRPGQGRRAQRNFRGGSMGLAAAAGFERWVTGRRDLSSKSRECAFAGRPSRFEFMGKVCRYNEPGSIISMGIFFTIYHLVMARRHGVLSELAAGP